jgi:hypothetical protein
VEKQEILKTLVKVQPSGEKDLYAPYSFLEWKNSRPSIQEKDLFLYYNRYVLEWFVKNKEKKITKKFLLRQKYLFLLDQLQLFFTTEEKNIWYNKINLSDDRELLLGIPYFAKKLKSIALYYLKLRKKLKNVKIKYNSIGSVRGIEQEIYQHILENFTSSNIEFDPEFQNILPDINILKNRLVVKVEEVYDDGEYTDKSPTAPLSAFVNILHEPTATFFSTKGIILSSDDWLFKTFTFPTSAPVEAFVAQLTSTIFSEQSDELLYATYVQQYLSEDKINLEFADTSSTIETYDIFLNQGNNYFYYPYGTTDTSLSIQVPVTPVALTALDIFGATSSNQLSSSDTIFVKNGDSVKGAWLYFKEFEESVEDVLALMGKNSKTSFIFPFPGYGLSAEDIDWTGSSLETEDEYQFLPPTVKASVNEAYWSQELPSDSTNELKLVETTLADDGAKAGKNSLIADKIFIRKEREQDTTVPRGSLSGAWLYRFERAAIPVSSRSNQNNIALWPYFRTDKFNEEEAEFLDYLSTTTTLTGTCDPVSVQSLDCSYFVAASSIELADKIYKLESYDPEATTIDATECCWLSSAEVVAGDYKYFKQKGISFSLEPSVATKFTWTGPTMALSSVFSGIEHDADCPHYTTPTSEWQKCSCKQVYYSPFGHSAETFERGNRHADYICLMAGEFRDEFDLDSWRDGLGLTFRPSEQFAWYKTPKQWGGGTWSRAHGDVSPMLLIPGQTYIYYRAGSRTKTEHPVYAVFKKFYKNSTCFPLNDPSEPNVKWVLAKKLNSGEWVSTGEESSMTLYSGDFVKFEKHQSTTSFYLSTSYFENQSENKGSIWAATDYIALDSASSESIISWPFVEGAFLAETYGNQVPFVSLASISAIVAWKIQSQETPSIVDVLESPYVYSESLSTNIYTNIFTFTFVPPQTGTYTISVTAVGTDGTKYEIPNNDTIIPNLSVVSQYSQEKIDISFTTPQASTLVEHPLSGWNYSTSDIGAKPYWAVLDSEKSSSTKSKGIREWGYENTFFDDYIPNAIPKMSDLTINYGDVVDYERSGRSFYWTQPVTYRTFFNSSQWCQLNWDTTSPSNLSSVFDVGLNDNLKVFPTFVASDIILSNNLNGAPVEIFYYALNSFVWTTSSTVVNEPLEPAATTYYDTIFTGLNLTNRFFPTVAAVPTLERIYNEKDFGSYFVPQNLGASQYINTNFTSSLKNPSLTGSYITEDTTIHIGGRGLTHEQQPTLHDWQENNEWLKEPPTTSGLAGTIKKQLTKMLQTFIPYQAASPQNSLGLNATDSTFSPWGGPLRDQWTDKTNEPISYTGVRNVSAWEVSQELSKNQQALDCWVSDIYGNQYGLFKTLSGIPIWQRPEMHGELWVKTNGNTIKPATTLLSSLYIQFNQKETIYNELTSKQVLNVDCFFDTLMIQTPSLFAFGKITYDYGTDVITLNTDDTRFKQLTADVLDFEQTWFLSQEKSVVTLFTETSTTSFYPSLYTYNLNTGAFVKIFPITPIEYNTLNLALSSYTPKEGRFVYNSSTRTYGITYHCTDANNDTVFVNIKLNRLEDLELASIDIYENRTADQANTMPPIVLTNYLSAIPITTNSTFNITVSAYNGPSAYSLIGYGPGSNQVTLNSTGTFTGNLTSSGLYQINYMISNDVGSTQYSLTLSSI